MRVPIDRGGRAGFSLMEIVISIGIIAVIIPIVMALTVAGGDGSRLAGEDTRAILVGRSAMEELKRARDGRGEFIKGELPWPAFPGSGGRIAFSVNREGRLTGLLKEGEYEQGMRVRGVDAIVSLQGRSYARGGDGPEALLSQVEMRIESPAAAAAEDRRAQVFVRLMHPDD